MDEFRSGPISNLATRRGVLKGIAAAGLGAAAVGLPGASSALADTTPGKSIDGPIRDEELRIGTPASPVWQTFSGLADFRAVLASNTWSFSGSYALRPTNASDGYSTDRLGIPHASLLLSATFYVLNTGASQSTCYLLRVDPTTSSFAPLISKQPAASTGGTQAVSLDLPGGLSIDALTYAYHLAWYNTAGDGSQVLYGAKLSYAYDPGMQFLATPVRVADTRSGSQIGPVVGPMAPGGSYDFPVSGANGIPTNANAVFGNLTAVEFNPGNGYMTIFPTGASLPNASSINFGGGEPNQLANFFQAKLGTAGKLRIFVSGAPTNAIIDITGYIV